MTREELIQELKRKYEYDLGSEWCYVHSNDLADFILSRERLLLEKIGKLLREGKGGQRYNQSVGISDRYEIAIDEALAIIEKEGVE